MKQVFGIIIGILALCIAMILGLELHHFINKDTINIGLNRLITLSVSSQILGFLCAGIIATTKNIWYMKGGG